MPTDLVSFNGSQFVGKPTLVDVEFVPALEKVNQFAADSGLQIHVTSAEPGAPRLLMLERPFMEGPDVRALQERLVELGFEMIPDGKFGPMTDSAITLFQQQNNLEPDGIVGSDTREVLKLGA
jgi:peptidoglycan hydrolase-like protein with peptidoglycan-binding domain